MEKKFVFVCLLCVVALEGKEENFGQPEVASSKPHVPCTITEAVANEIGSGSASDCTRLLNVGFGGYALTDNFSPKTLGTSICDVNVQLPICCIQECAWRTRCTDGQIVVDVRSIKRRSKILCCKTNSHVISESECKRIKVERNRLSVPKSIHIDNELKEFHGLSESALITKFILVDRRPRKITARFELCNATLDVNASCVQRAEQDKQNVREIVETAVGSGVGVPVPFAALGDSGSDMGLVIGLVTETTTSTSTSTTTTPPVCGDIIIVPLTYSSGYTVPSPCGSATIAAAGLTTITLTAAEICGPTGSQTFAIISENFFNCAPCGWGLINTAPYTVDANCDADTGEWVLDTRDRNGGVSYPPVKDTFYVQCTNTC